MKKILLLLVMVPLFLPAHGQENFFTKKGTITFYSHTPVEDITAENSGVGSIINSSTGEIVFTLKMTDFIFPKKLMQKHFNDNYVESDKFPKATYKGTIINNDSVNYQKEGSYPVMVTGEMYIHGVTREVDAEGTISVTGEGIEANAVFMLQPENYGIKIPRLVRKRLAENVEITVDMSYKPM